jgi:hypothetical protein
MMAEFHKKGVFRGCQRLISEQQTTCINANTYYMIGGTWGGASCVGFERDGKGKITYTDGTGVVFLLNGTSDVQADKNCTITYALFKNGQLVDGAETPHTFEHANSIANISITAIVEGLICGDYLEIYCKSDQSNTLVTSNTLIITFYGDK